MPRDTVSELVRAYWPIVIGAAGLIGGAIGFVLNDAPLLASRIDGSSRLEWSDTALPGVCRAKFHVTFKNIGTSALATSKVRVRAWILDESASVTGRASFVDTPRILRTTTPLTDIVYTEPNTRETTAVRPPLVGSYYAGMAYNHTFEWNVARNPQGNFFVYVELFPGVSDTETAWHFGAWSPTCEQVPG